MGELGLPRNGLPSLIEKVKQEEFRSFRMDKRLTGASIIDEPLQEVLHCIFVVTLIIGNGVVAQFTQT
jgi:hypothetical protein